MPIYTYKCNECSGTFEKFIRLANRENPISEPCPACGKLNCIKQIIVTNFELMAPDSLGRIKPSEDWRSFLNERKK